MYDGIESIEVVGRHVTDVALPLVVPCRGWPEVTSSVVERVEPGHLVSSRGQRWGQHRSHIPVMPGDEDSHGAPKKVMVVINS